uniref:LRAT domain-containing protein n=1 Tax=Salmo trutta TaxID=8032 RepID=A0A674B174_SALTR
MLIITNDVSPIELFLFKFTFGDIIKIPRTTLGISSYNRYAIYVADKNIRGKVPGQDIFHFSGEITDPGNANCVFAKLEDVTENSTPEVQNRDTADLKMRKVEDMIQDITTLHNRCKGLYGPISDNCEHLATVIRYGSATCKQNRLGRSTVTLAIVLVNPWVLAIDAVKKSMELDICQSIMIDLDIFVYFRCRIEVAPFQV